MGSHWWSGVGSIDRLLSVSVHKDGLIGVLEDGSELPGVGSILSRGDANKGKNSEIFHFLYYNAIN